MCDGTKGKRYEDWDVQFKALLVMPKWSEVEECAYQLITLYRGGDLPENRSAMTY